MNQMMNWRYSAAYCYEKDKILRMIKIYGWTVHPLLNIMLKEGKLPKDVPRP